MITTAPASAARPARNRRRPAFVVTLSMLRITAAVHAVLAVLQPVWIGGYLDGVYPMLGRHATFAGVLILSGMALGAAGIAYAATGGRVWAAGLGLFFLAEGVQTGMGYGRQLAIHIPLGVAIVGGAIVVAIWTWTRSAARDRRTIR